MIHVLATVVIIITLVMAAIDIWKWVRGGFWLPRYVHLIAALAALLGVGLATAATDITRRLKRAFMTKTVVRRAAGLGSVRGGLSGSYLFSLLPPMNRPCRQRGNRVWRSSMVHRLRISGPPAV